MNLWQLTLTAFGIGVVGGLSIPFFNGERIVWGAVHGLYLLWRNK